MNLSAIDWAIVAAYFLLSTVIGLAFTKRGGESLNEYFLSGRQVTWWLAGASMVATTFAADTPLVVTGLVSAHGVAGNWLWWNMLMSGMLTVFFFARLWRRAHVMTDVEFAEIRYSGRPAAVLRGFRALYLAIPINLIILGWVTKAMIKILTISLGVSPVLAVGICFVITVAYSAGAGMWAVLWTDLVQFVIKMSAVIVLAVYSVRAVGGIGIMRTKLAEHFGSETAALSVMPVSVSNGGLHAYAWMPLLALGVPLGPVVGGVVSGRRARRRRLRRAANLLRQNGARWRSGHALLQCRALRDQAVAVDHHRTCDGHSLPEPRGQGIGLRARVRGLPADSVARLHDGGLRGRLHVHGRQLSSTGARPTSSTISTSASSSRRKRTSIT